MKTTFTRRAVATVTAILAGSLLLSACAGQSETKSQDTKPAQTQTDAKATFPVTFKNADGTTTEIKTQPKAVLSTTPSVTGTLLAIDAPVKASAADANGKFFSQWEKIAKERGVQQTWSVGKPDIEQATAAAPDLIVVSKTGQDSMLKEIEQLKKIAPTIVVDYDDQSWQDLAKQLAPAFGKQKEAEKVIADYEAYAKTAAAKIKVPTGPINIVSYNGPGKTNNIALDTSAHYAVLKELGFKEFENPKKEWHTQPNQRKDFVFANYEHLTELTAPTTFLIRVDESGIAQFKNDATLANVPSVKSGQVYALGKDSFRIDYYSAKSIIDSVVKQLGK